MTKAEALLRVELAIEVGRWVKVWLPAPYIAPASEIHALLLADDYANINIKLRVFTPRQYEKELQNLLYATMRALQDHRTKWENSDPESYHRHNES